MNDKIRRFNLANFETREAGGKKYIEGYFAKFNSPTELWTGYTEIISPGAFAEDISSGADVRALDNHNERHVLGRTKSNTLELREDNIGLWGRIEINEEDSDAMNLYSRVRRGDIDQCSIGFEILERKIEYHSDETTTRTIIKVKLFEVSVVTFPAYEDTSVVARSREYENISTEKTKLWQDKAKAKLKGAKNNA